MAWFTDWFGTPYYNALYAGRDEQEARFFISNLMAHFRWPQGTCLVDAGCGNGRHAMVLDEAGHKVYGIDIMPDNIAAAKALRLAHAEFFLHDMRLPFPVKDCDAVLNLFTSFGYLDTREEDLLVLRNMFHALRPGGDLVLDYLNRAHVLNTLVQHEEKQINGYHYIIQRKVEQGRIVKGIRVDDHGRQHFFEERVNLYTPEQLAGMVALAGFEIVSVRGDYQLGPFLSGSSPRCIVHARRPTTPTA